MISELNVPLLCIPTLEMGSSKTLKLYIERENAKLFKIGQIINLENSSENALHSMILNYAWKIVFIDERRHAVFTTCSNYAEIHCEIAYKLS